MTVVGTGSFTRTDGSTGVLADAVFNTGAAAAQDQFRLAAANSNNVLLGAVAAAGLLAVPAAAHSSIASDGGRTVDDAKSFATGGDHPAMNAATDASRSALTGEAREAVEASAAPSPANLAHEPDHSDAHALTDAANAPAASPTELLQGTDAPVHGDLAASTMVANAVAMPSAAMLQAQASANSIGDAHSTAEVARVLADALSGGHGGPDIDALLHVATGHDGGAAQLAEMMASYAGPAGSAWDMSGLAGFAMVHPDMGMEALAVHMDALPTA